MEGKNRYDIIVDFRNSNRSIIYKGPCEYLGSTGSRDELVIKHNRISIVAYRSSKINLDAIFNNPYSSLYNQLVKALAYYYCIIGRYVVIKRIAVSRSIKVKLIDKKELLPGDIRQIISKTFRLNYPFDPAKLGIILTESEKGKMILHSITHLIRANITPEEHERFDWLWKSFNPLYRLIGQAPKEFDCLVGTKTFMINNKNLFHFSIPTVTGITAIEFRQALRWRAMIINNFPREEDTNNFRNSIIRYSDCRIMAMYQETLGNREAYLKNKGYYGQVVTHINNSIVANTIVDIEVLAILTLKYMYFVRNKSFHGEKIASTFRLTNNKEVNEFKWLNIRLEPLLFDLINMNDIF